MPHASLVCTIHLPHPPLQCPKNCASIKPSSTRRLGSATSESASWHTSYYPPLPPPLTQPREMGRPAAKNIRGRPRVEKTTTVWNHRLGRSFLVDCGTYESVFPASAADKRHHASSAPLVVANDTLIKTCGKHEASLVLGKEHTFTQEFHVADVTVSLIGTDFLASNRLVIDMSNKRPISLDDSNVVATGVASVCSTICIIDELVS